MPYPARLQSGAEDKIRGVPEKRRPFYFLKRLTESEAGVAHASADAS